MIQFLRKAIQIYKKIGDEKASLLQAGIKRGDLDEAMTNERWRTAVDIVNGYTFGAAKNEAMRIIKDPSASNNQKLKAIELIGSWFQPGATTTDEKTDISERWPEEGDFSDV